MAIYPALNQEWSSTRNPVTNTKIDLATDGTVRGTSQFTETVYDFTIKHPLITTDQKNSIQTFYDTNKNLLFQFVYDGDSLTYDLVFKNEPTVIPRAPGYWDVMLYAIGTKQ